MYRLDGQIPLSLNQFSCVIADNYALPITPISIKKKTSIKLIIEKQGGLNLQERDSRAHPLQLGPTQSFNHTVEVRKPVPGF